MRGRRAGEADGGCVCVGAAAASAPMRVMACHSAPTVGGGVLRACSEGGAQGGCVNRLCVFFVFENIAGARWVSKNGV